MAKGKGYNDVELTEEELQSLDPLGDVRNPIETTESQQEPPEEETPSGVNEPEVKGESVGSEEPEAEFFDPKNYVIEVDGKQHSFEDVMEWRNDSQNKEKWNKSNTEKAQGLAKWNKFIKKVAEDSDFNEHIKDYFWDKDGELEKLGLDKGLSVIDDIVEKQEQEVEETQTVQQALDPELSRRIQSLEQAEAERALETDVNNLEDELEDLQKSYPEYLKGETEVMDFLSYCEDTQSQDLTDSFKIWSFDQVKGEQTHRNKLNENKQRNEGSVIDKSEQGAKEVRVNKQYKGWNDMANDDPELLRYLED
tara:strand:+ start:3084 stop:4007 length:924 start_codon:yes stop_codon:yes gene_type:complete